MGGDQREGGGKAHLLAFGPLAFVAGSSRPATPGSLSKCGQPFHQGFARLERSFFKHLVATQVFKVKYLNFKRLNKV